MQIIHTLARATLCAALALPSLRLVSSEPLRGRDSYEALGLSGANKPNGLPYRLRLDVPDSLPDFVPREEGGLPLLLAQRVPEGWVALFATPVEERSLRTNAAYRAALYAPDGSRVWSLDLNRFLSRPRDLEIQDLRFRDGRLYFNEACQSYAREAGGRCSSLVRVDPARETVEWRTRPRVSNGVFIFARGQIVAGYGFTAEPDSLFLVSPTSGRVLSARPLDSAHSYLEERGGVVHVVTNARLYRFRVAGE